MLPLAALLLICIYVFVERTVAVSRAARYDDNFMHLSLIHI